MIRGYLDVRALAISQGPHSPQRSVEFMEGMASVTIASAGISLVLVEVLDFGVIIVVMSSWVIQKVKEQNRKALVNKVDKEFGAGT